VVGSAKKTERNKKIQRRMEITRMEMGMGTLMGVLMVEASPKVGVKSIKGPSIAITQKDFLREHIVKEERR